MTERDIRQFKREAEALSQKLNAVSEQSFNNLTAKNPNLAISIHTVLTNASVFCRSLKPCQDKAIHVTSDKHRRYRLCLFDGNCNQQTRDRVEASL